MDRNKEEDHAIDNINIRPYQSSQILQSQIHPKVYTLFVHPNMREPYVVGYKASISNLAHLLHRHINRRLLVLKDVIIKNIQLSFIKNHWREQGSISWTEVE